MSYKGRPGKPHRSGGAIFPDPRDIALGEELTDAENRLALEINGDCNTCGHWRMRMNRRKGVRIPGGYGKCTRPEGHCNPAKPKKGIEG